MFSIFLMFVVDALSDYGRRSSIGLHIVVVVWVLCFLKEWNGYVGNVCLCLPHLFEKRTLSMGM